MVFDGPRGPDDLVDPGTEPGAFDVLRVEDQLVGLAAPSRQVEGCPDRVEVPRRGVHLRVVRHAAVHGPQPDVAAPSVLELERRDHELDFGARATELSLHVEAHDPASDAQRLAQAQRRFGDARRARRRTEVVVVVDHVERVDHHHRHHEVVVRAAPARHQVHVALGPDDAPPVAQRELLHVPVGADCDGLEPLGQVRRGVKDAQGWGRWNENLQESHDEVVRTWGWRPHSS